MLRQPTVYNADWKFDENDGSQVDDEFLTQSGNLVGINDSDRVFGFEGKSIRFEGDGGHVVIKGYKGVLGSSARTISFWIKPRMPMQA